METNPSPTTPALDSDVEAALRRLENSAEVARTLSNECLGDTPASEAAMDGALALLDPDGDERALDTIRATPKPDDTNGDVR